jgi:hypothetical protein
VRCFLLKPSACGLFIGRPKKGGFVARGRPAPRVLVSLALLLSGRTGFSPDFVHLGPKKRSSFHFPSDKETGARKRAFQYSPQLWS